jgi:ferrous iron transport protein B
MMGGCAHCSDDAATEPVPGDIVVALAGNPNTGKSSIFNSLTGSSQHVGNWPGKTVSRAYGSFEHGPTTVQIVDLPGTYSLNASSPEEQIARDYLISGQPDVVAIVVDASNLERNLYLAVQVLEIGVPSLVALNMVDVVESQGSTVDIGLLSEHLGVRVVPTVARKRRGLNELKNAMIDVVSMELAS